MVTNGAAAPRAKDAARVVVAAPARQVDPFGTEAVLTDGLLAAVDTTLDGSVAVDQVMLRDLVQRVLREELEGPLGERITRNVRKLVRAEIARALMLRDQD